VLRYTAFEKKNEDIERGGILVDVYEKAYC